MAFAVLNMSEDEQKAFAQAINDVSSKIHRCPHCGLYTETDRCEVCDSEERDHTLLAVVANVKDALAIEKMNSFNGVYHVLGGTLSATRGISANDLKVDELVERVKNEGIKEVILATNPTLEGETTALFIAKMLEPLNIQVTRLGYGLPMGSSLDYADKLTLTKAFEGRKKI